MTQKNLCFVVWGRRHTVGEKLNPLLNKAGGAGIQVTAYTRTTADTEAGIGHRAKAGQILGNFNTHLVMRVRNEESVRVLTEQLTSIARLNGEYSERAIDVACQTYLKRPW